MAKITLEINENEILEMAKKMVAEQVAKEMFNQYHTSSNYCYRTVIKECVREVIKSDIDNLSERAVSAASVSIENKGIKKLLSTLQGDIKNS